MTIMHTFRIICLERGEDMEFIDVATLFIGVAIIVAGGTIYAAIEKLTKALEKQK